MPTYTTTTKRALRWLTGANLVNDIDAGFQALAEDLDGKIATDDQGNLTSRPAAALTGAGAKGSYYTDEHGTTWRSNGTTWYMAGGRKPRALLSTTGVTLTASSGTSYSATWPTEDSDEWGMRDPTVPVAAPGAYVTVPFAGLWLVHVDASWAANANGMRKLILFNHRGPGDDVQLDYSLSVGYAGQSRPAEINYVASLAAGNALNVTHLQDSGSALAVGLSFSAVMLSS